MRQVSLTRRVIFLSSMWTMLAIAILGWILLSQFRSGAERNFSDLQQAQLFSLIGAVDVDESGNFTGYPNLGNSSFLRPGSGWFWRVQLIEPQTTGAISSPSFDTMKIERPTLTELPYSVDFSRSFVVEDLEQPLVRVLESEIDLGGGLVGLFQVGANETEFRTGIRQFAVRTLSLLGIFGFGAVAINVLVILFGLRPLERIKNALSDIRAGRADKLEGEFPTELAPMVAEMNTLVDNNRKIVERARTQVGNLAHSLKTPIAVLLNESSGDANVSPDVVQSQAETMQSQVQHYLARARIAAQAGSVTYRTNATEAIEKLLRVMGKLSSEKEFVIDIRSNNLIFAGEQEDLNEIIGNLLENACKWGRDKIAVTAWKDRAPNDKPILCITIEDDGPGVEADKRNTVLRRGQRLDEATPGTGLGLSIVNDTIGAYGGSIVLTDSKLGGLKVTVQLPSA